MPVIKRGNKYYFGGRKYKSKAAANRSYRAYLAKKHGKKK